MSHRSLAGPIDTHLHSAPDVRPRLLDDLEASRQAAAAGMRAIVLKSHVTLTADRAVLAERRSGGGLRVFGGLALNRSVGGPNPSAVETALRMGAAIVWLPTNSATTSASTRGRGDGRGRVTPALGEVLALVAEADVGLATGHPGPTEAGAAVRAARGAGVRRIVVTHPEAPLNAMPLDLQRALVRGGAMIERCLVSIHEPNGPSLDDVAAQIRGTGAAANVVATDYGQPENVPPVAGPAAFPDALAERGFSEGELGQPAGANPARLLGLE